MNRTNRMRWGFAALAAVSMGALALADDVPFARSVRPGESYLMSLADIMTFVQLRHIKLGEAISAGNAPLAAFEARLMADNLVASAMLYQAIPIEFVEAAAKPLVALQDPVAQKDPAKAKLAFANLTTACNACHQAAGVGFITIAPPKSSPFGNQIFAPVAKD